MAKQKQPQEIMSSDNIIQTLHHRMSANRFGHRTVTGVVKNIGSDLGGAVKGFKKSMDEGAKDQTEKLEKTEEDVIEGEATREKDNDKA